MKIAFNYSYKDIFFVSVLFTGFGIVIAFSPLKSLMRY